MYRALITDLDGTAIPISSDGSDIDATTHRAVAQAVARGYKIACATGRHWEITEPIVRRLGLVHPCIIEGGTRLVDAATGRTLWEKSFPPGVAQQLLAILHREVKAGQLMTSAANEIIRLEDTHSLPDGLRLLYLLALPEALATKLVNQITDHEATKQHAIKAWQKLEGVTQSETIGMGDSGNDLPIFEASGLKVAVANATPDVKELADYIAPSVTDHALAHVIEKFML